MDTILTFIRDYFMFCIVFTLGYVLCALLSISRRNSEMRAELDQRPATDRAPEVILPEYFTRAQDKGGKS